MQPSLDAGSQRVSLLLMLRRITFPDTADHAGEPADAALCRGVLLGVMQSMLAEGFAADEVQATTREVLARLDESATMWLLPAAATPDAKTLALTDAFVRKCLLAAYKVDDLDLVQMPVGA